MSSSLVLGAIAAVVALGAIFTRTYLRLRGTRVVTCPDNQQPAAVDLAASQATLGALLGGQSFRLDACSRWPEKLGCGQECLAQVHASPESCLVRRIAGDWYQGQDCALCRKPFGEIHWHDRRPALRTAAGETLQWTEIAAEKLPATLRECLPVCWSCHVAESFRREHSDLVVERPPRPRPDHA